MKLSKVLHVRNITFNAVHKEFLNVLNMNKPITPENLIDEGLTIVLHTYTSECRGHNQARDFLELCYAKKTIDKQLTESFGEYELYDEVENDLNNQIDKNKTLNKILKKLQQKYPQLGFNFSINYNENIKFELHVSK